MLATLIYISIHSVRIPLTFVLQNEYLQGVPKKVGFTTCNSSSKSHFFLGHLVVDTYILKTTN